MTAPCLQLLSQSSSSSFFFFRDLQVFFCASSGQSISKQMKKISLSRAGKPAAKAKPKHIFGKFDVKVIKKQMKTNQTSSTGKPVANARMRTLKWIKEFK